MKTYSFNSRSICFAHCGVIMLLLLAFLPLIPSPTFSRSVENPLKSYNDALFTMQENLIELSGDSYGTTFIQLLWSPINGAEEYLLDVSTTATFTSFFQGYQNFSIKPDKERVAQTYKIIGLNSETTYFCRIRARTTAGFSAYSDILMVKTMGATPPTGLNSIEITAQSFRIVWQDVIGAVAYQIDIAYDPAMTRFVQGYEKLRLSTNSNILVQVPSPAATTYFYRIRTIFPTMRSGYSDVYRVNTSPIASPVALPAASMNQNSFTARWSTVASASAYWLDVALDSLFTRYIYKSRQVYPGAFFNRSPEYTVGYLSPGTTYYYRVRASAPLYSTSANSMTVAVTLPPLITIAAPLALVPTYRNATSFTAVWQKITSASYTVDVAKDKDFLTIISSVKEYSDTNLVITNVDPDTEYYYRVRAKTSYSSESGYSNSIVIRTRSEAITPPAPVVLGAHAITARGFECSWKPIPDIAPYLLDLALDSGFTNIILNNSTVYSTFARVSGLRPGTTYYYRLRACFRDQITGGFSPTHSVTTLSEPRPQLLPPKNIGSGGFTLSWIQPIQTKFAFIDLAEDSLFTKKVRQFQTAFLSNSSHYISGLSPQKKYFYRIRVGNDTTDLSVYSAIENVQTLDVMPAPKALPAIYVGHTSLNASWQKTAPKQNIYGELALDSAFTLIIKRFCCGHYYNFSTTINFLEPNTNYYYRLSAGDSLDYTITPWNKDLLPSSPYSSTIRVTTLPLPITPVALVPAYYGSTGFAASWKHGSGWKHEPSLYQWWLLEVATDSLFDNVVVGPIESSQTSEVIRSLQPNTRYYYRVRIKSRSVTDYEWSYSQYSNIVSMTTQAPLAVPHVMPATPSTLGFIVNWKPVTGATTYWLDVARDSTFRDVVHSNIRIWNAFTTSYQLANLPAGQPFYYRMRAGDSYGPASDYSAVMTVEAKPALPPIALSPIYVGSNSVVASWKPAATDNNLQYFLEVSKDSVFHTVVQKLPFQSGTRATVVGLEAEGKYFYRLRLQIADTSAQSYSQVIAFQLLPALLPPTILTATSGSQSVALRWSTITSSRTYWIQIAKDVNFTTLIADKIWVVATTNPNYTVLQLQPNSRYYARVSAGDLYSSSGVYSPPVPFTTLSALPAPEALPAISASTKTFEARWNSVPNAQSYHLQVSTDSLYQNNLVFQTSVLSPTMIVRYLVNMNINHSSRYFYRVRTTDKDGLSGEFSKTITVETLPPPLPPTGLITTVTPTGFTLQWNKIPSASRYLLELSKDSSYKVITLTRVLMDTIITITDLSAQTQYFYRLQARDANEVTSAYSAITPVKTTSLPIPLALPPSSIGKTLFTAECQAIDGIPLYVFEVARDSLFTQILWKNIQSKVPRVTVNWLQSGTLYYYRVRTSDGLSAGFSGFSNVVLVKTLPNPDNNVIIDTLSIKPNPFVNDVFFELRARNTSRVTLQIFSSQGAEVLYIEKPVVDTDIVRFEWLAQHYPSGLYYYRLIGEFGNTFRSGTLLHLR